jgi:ubiquinone/menaquinone biosynthesis C-methylase UbiE
MDNVKNDRPSEEEMWAGPSGERWLANAVRFEGMLKPIGEAVIAAAGVKPGERVIDVGCGAGWMSLEMARRVGDAGSVTGLDISGALVAEGERRAREAGLRNVRFVKADAARSGLPAGAADCLASRFGVMFFSDPYGAFAHLRSLLKPGGRLTVAVWAPMKENPWMLEVRNAVAAHFELPQVPPRTPGPFAFEEQAYFEDVLARAGFGGVGMQPWEGQLSVGGDAAGAPAAADFMLQAMSLAQRALDAPEVIRARVRDDLVARLKGYEVDGSVRMPAKAWIVTARA